MMKGKPMRRALQVAAVVLLAACGCDSDSSRVGPGTHGSIRGTVTDDTGATVEDAAVALTGNAQPARTTSSGADGGYAFADVPPGTYTLAVTPPAGFTLGAADTASVTVASGAPADAPAIVLYSCAVVRPDFGGPATTEDLALFAYDVNAPLNLEKIVQDTVNGVERSNISYDSPAGGRVTGMLFEPGNHSGPRPGIVILHGTGQNGASLAGWATGLATSSGIVGIAIDAPFARRTGPYMQHTLQDRVEMIQVIKDLQRAVDVLRAHPNVDHDRIAFHGLSYGGAMGALFVGVEHRLRAAVLEVPDAGPVTHWTGPEDHAFMASLSCERRNAWFRAMTPIEPIRFIPHATIPLLQQNGWLDDLVNVSDAEALHAAMPEPKTMLWYDAGHGLTPQALTDRLNWLQQQIGIDPP